MYHLHWGSCKKVWVFKYDFSCWIGVLISSPCQISDAQTQPEMKLVLLLTLNVDKWWPFAPQYLLKITELQIFVKWLVFHSRWLYMSHPDICCCCLQKFFDLASWKCPHGNMTKLNNTFHRCLQADFFWKPSQWSKVRFGSVAYFVVWSCFAYCQT